MSLSSRSFMATVFAVVCVCASGLVAPSASAEGIGKGRDVQGCDDVLVQVSKAKKLDGVVVAKGVYGLGVDGISCDEAESLVEDWVDSGRVDQGFDAIVGHSDPAGSIVFEDARGTKRSGDDQEIVLVAAKNGLACLFGGCPLGSTVTILNQSGIRSGTYPDIIVSNDQGVSPTPVTLPFYGQNSVKYSRKGPSSTPVDLFINVNAVGAGDATNYLEMVAESSAIFGGTLCVYGPLGSFNPLTNLAQGDYKCTTPSVGDEIYFSFRDSLGVRDQVRGFVRRVADENGRYTYRVTLYLTN